MDSETSLSELVRDVEISRYKKLGRGCKERFSSQAELTRETGIDTKRYDPNEKGFNRIVRRSRPDEYLGYECPNCKIVVGPPRIETKETDATRRRGVSQDAVTYFCRICNEKLYEHVLRMEAVD